MKFKSTLGACALAVTTLSGLVNAAPTADKIYYGNHIVTMDAAQPTAEAVAIEDNTIIYVGSREGAKDLLSETTETVELGDKALIPGMIDSHGHVTMAARLIDYVNVSSPPVGTAETVDDILQLLKTRLATNPPAKGQWLMAYGYDDSLLKENRHPTREDLDKVSTEVPIYLMHVSGHLGTSNSAALAIAGVDKETVNPEGGVFRRLPGTTIPNGVVEEKAMYKLLMPQFMAASQDPQQYIEKLFKAIDYFAQYGITTIQDGASQMGDVKLLTKLGDEGKLKADIIAFPTTMIDHLPDNILGLYKEGYHGGFRVGGVKFVLDGSPQGRTAWTTKPYNENPDGVTGHYHAYPTVEIDVFKAQAKVLLSNGVPVYMHGNGDAAIDLSMDAIDEAFAGKKIPDHRSVIIHSQVMRPDQVDRAAELKMVPSFFASHVFFWGDWHRKSFGEARAAHISPGQDALDKGVHFTIHNDSPVVPPDMMRLMWAAVNRQTRSGYVLGPDQRISAYDALYAMTMGGAYQYFEEDKKGSLTVGKQADMVILGANPLTVDPTTIKDIPILETIARGKTIYQKVQ
ncbi:amidohydrolase [Halioxenophilus sp. WMMB6]|uniref:amidohydrolase n=1 Tax=Halioxenophilus sp. WMMB6 TaxID=3073815 RepID=UPI00295E7C0A|nr:amidohydrolase [Halioxenophilus sp. WMMB6]